LVVTDVSGQPLGPIFNENLHVSPEISVTTYHCLRNIPEKRR